MQWNEKWISPDNPKIILVQPPESENYREIKSNFKFAPPTWAAILASETRRRSKREIDFEIIYPPEADMSQAFLEKCATADILGITDWFSCHRSAMEIAKYTKKINPEILIVIGGINAGFLADRILRNHSAVDLIVWDDGEDVLWRILEGDDFSTIPNLWFRKKTGEIKMPSCGSIVNLDELGLWNFDDVIKPPILRDYIKEVNENPFATAPTGVSITRGCGKFRKYGACTYCTAYSDYREMNPGKAWEQLKHLRKSGIKYFFETGDDFSSLIYFEKLLNLRSEEDDFFLRCYANPAYISAKVGELMKNLGFYEVFLGMETLNQKISKEANRIAISSCAFEKAVQALDKVGINVCLPVMFGLPGETVQTAESTARKLIRLVNNHKNIRLILVSLAIPLIGSQWFGNLHDSDVVVEYHKAGHNIVTDDDFDYLELLRLSLKMTGVEIEKILQVMEWLKGELKNKVEIGSFGAIEKTNIKRRFA